MINHIAIIPGRKGSKGFPCKNRLFFSLTANFVRNSELFDRVIVTSDDEMLLQMADNEGFEAYRRPDSLASDTASIRDVFLDLAANHSFNSEDYLWLFFITILYRDISDFHKARKVVDEMRPPLLCAFVPVKTHPFATWYVKNDTGKMNKFIPNDYYRRQDYPNAWEDHHYVFCIQVAELPNVNSNLFSDNIYPLFLSSEKSGKLVDINEVDDFKKWMELHPEDYAAWRENLSGDVQLPEF